MGGLIHQIILQQFFYGGEMGSACSPSHFTIFGASMIKLSIFKDCSHDLL